MQGQKSANGWESLKDKNIEIGSLEKEREKEKNKRPYDCRSLEFPSPNGVKVKCPELFHLYSHILLSRELYLCGLGEKIKIKTKTQIHQLTTRKRRYINLWLNLGG